ncbi:hypothetical protein ACIQ6K_36700, partial [Streptomyces sp. NPDC096354]|uniref:hypothetical protein n=1 Tax=Streptomyces sp. NPDC096354 TaxID=3366088 RepID=UPI0038089C8A
LVALNLDVILDADLGRRAVGAALVALNLDVILDADLGRRAVGAALVALNLDVIQSGTRRGWQCHGIPPEGSVRNEIGYDRKAVASCTLKELPILLNGY